jgi:hypothetical protein
MQPRVPTGITNQDLYNKSVGQVLAGNVSAGNGLTFAASDGTPLTYSTDNMGGVMIRIGSTANPNALQYVWPAVSTNLTITHNLNKLPYGFILTASYAATEIFWGTIAPTTTEITLQTSNASYDTTIWILA